MARRVVLASANPGKLREFAELIAPWGFELVAQSTLGIGPIPETGKSFLENALIKARHASHHAQLAALADDSGLEVDALGGAPGVYSARFAGEHADDRRNLEKLLIELRGTQPNLRTARFRCVLVLIRNALDPHPIVGQGAWEGLIAERPHGTSGFGYDPIFTPEGFNCTVAELDAAHKNALSHRAQAWRELSAQLPSVRV